MQHCNRRVFTLQLVAASSALAARQAGAADETEKVLEADPYARSMGFRLDTAQVDKAKYPQHAATQVCGGCNFYQGKPTDAMAPCQLFAGKQVAGKGWCTAFAKKA